MSGKTESMSAEATRIEIRQRLLVFLVGFLIALFIEGFDSFGLASLKDRHSAGLASVLEQLSPSNYNEAAQEAVTVFLVDPETKSRIGFDQPYLPYSTLASFLGTLVDARPKAIFLDYSYNIHTSDPAGLKKLIAVATRAKEAGVHIYTGAISDHKDMKDLKRAVTEVSFSWDRSVGLDYPFVGSARFETVDSARALTAAPMIYRDLCRGDQHVKNTFKCDFEEAISELLINPNGSSAITIDNASHLPSPLFQTYIHYRKPKSGTAPESGPELLCSEESGLNRMERVVARGLFRSVDASHGGPPNCIAVPYYSLSRIHMPLPGVTPFANRRLMETRVRDKIVMIGDGLGEDRYDVPVFGYIEGVFHHAIALQDLLSEGGGYTRWPEKVDLERWGLPFAVGKNFLIEWGISFLVVLATLVIWHHRKATTETQRWFLLLGLGAAITLPIVLASLVSITVVQVLRWPTVNILNIFGTVAGLLTLMELDRLMCQRWRWIAAILGSAAIISLLISWRLISVLG